MADEQKNSEYLGRPLSYKIYKGMKGKNGCFQFNLKPAYTSAKKDDGAVFIEAAPATGDNIYDWEHKIIFALNINDIGVLLAGFRTGKANLLHDPGAQTDRSGAVKKYLNLTAGKDPGTYFMDLTEQTGDDKKVVKIPIASGESVILVKLLEAAIPIVLSW